MAIQGIKMLPPVVTTKQALSLYKKVSKIKTKIGFLNSELQHSIINTGLIQIFTLNESVQSTRIEGTQVTFADMIDESSKKKKSTEVREVENYMDALETGVEKIKEGSPISTRLIQDLHKILMSDSRGTTAASGEYRKIQNFIGPNNKIEDAVYIPVSAADIPKYMTNLEYYINSEHHPSFDVLTIGEGEEALDENDDILIKTAILHAQFESIHPFLDGNGRMGRILIILATMLTRLVDFPVFFVSEELEKERIRYYNLLNGTRGNNPDWYRWIEFFLNACERTADSMLKKLREVDVVVEEGLKKLELEKGTHTISQVWLATFGRPYVQVKDISSMLNLSNMTVRMYLNKLVDLKLLDVDLAKRKNKVYVNYDLIRLLE